MTGMALLVCCTFAVLLCLPVQAYENLALHRPAWQSSTWVETVSCCEKQIKKSFTADLAVDGKDTDLAWDGGQCAASDGWKTTAEWRVDLGGVRSIHHIVIQYATNNRVWDKENILPPKFLGFSVYISNTTIKEDGVLCFRDTNYTRATIPNPVNITCPYHGRYVIYYNNRTHPPYPEDYSYYAWNTLCEVEVYGDPPVNSPNKVNLLSDIVATNDLQEDNSYTGQQKANCTRIFDQPAEKPKISSDDVMRMQYEVLKQQKMKLKEETMHFRLMNKKLRKELGLPNED
ncbi:uncharacterized protein LOC144623748 [Crassostrea virginica]